MYRRVASLICLLFACSSPSPPKSDPIPAKPQPLERARALIEALERGDAEPLAALVTSETTWDGIAADGTYNVWAAGTTREHIIAAGQSSRAHFGEFRRIAHVWQEGRFIHLISEHASGDFVFLVALDAADKLKHLGFLTRRRPTSAATGPVGCSPTATSSRRRET